MMVMLLVMNIDERVDMLGADVDGAAAGADIPGAAEAVLTPVQFAVVAERIGTVPR